MGRCKCMDTKSQDMNWREAYAGIFTTTSEQELYYHFTSYIKKDLKVIILMPDSLQGDGYRKTTHPQPIYNVVICNVNSVCCLYHAKSFKNIRFCDTVIVETMLVMKVIQHFSCHTTITLKAVCTIDLYTTIKNSKN